MPGPPQKRVPQVSLLRPGIAQPPTSAAPHQLAGLDHPKEANQPRRLRNVPPITAHRPTNIAQRPPPIALHPSAIALFPATRALQKISFLKRTIEPKRIYPGEPPPVFLVHTRPVCQPSLRPAPRCCRENKYPPPGFLLPTSAHTRSRAGS
jgi:hypothetical protein